ERRRGSTRLWRAGSVEPVTPSPMPAHLLAHQRLALALQEGAIGGRTWTEWLGDPPVFGPDVALLDDAVVEHPVAPGYLHADGGTLSIGRQADLELGRRTLIDPTAAFTTPPASTRLAPR